MVADNILKIGLDENSYTSCLKNTESFLNECPDMRVQGIAYWLSMLWKGEIHLRVYPVELDGGYNASVLEDLKTGIIDLNPIDYVIEEGDLKHYSVLSNFDFTPYYFYGKQPDTKQNAFLFLMSPFNWHNWLLFSVTLTLLTAVVFAVKFANNSSHRRLSLNALSKIRLIFVAFMLELYMSNLKALLTVRDDQIPFRNLYELAEKIASSDAKLYLESRSTLRWYLLMDAETDKAVEFKKIENALKSHDRDSNKSLVIVENMTVLCDAVSSLENRFYFSYEKLIEANCPNFCFWTYEIKELHPMGTSFLLPKNFSLLESANILIHAMPMYQTNTLRIKKLVKKNCNRRNEMVFVYPNIGLESLIGAINLFLLGCCLSCLVFVAEKTWRKYCLCLRRKKLRKNYLKLRS